MPIFLSLCKQYSLGWHFLWMASTFLLKARLLSMTVPRYLYSPLCQQCCHQFQDMGLEEGSFGSQLASLWFLKHSGPESFVYTKYKIFVLHLNRHHQSLNDLQWQSILVISVPLQSLVYVCKKKKPRSYNITLWCTSGCTEQGWKHRLEMDGLGSV